MKPSARPGPTVATRLFASAHFLLAVTPVFWAANWTIGRGLRDSPPFTMTFVRWTIAAGFMLAFCWPDIRAGWPVIRRHWRWLLPVAMMGGGLNNVLGYIGLKYTTAINGIFLNSFVPMMIVLLTWMSGRERLGIGQLPGIVISFAGVAVIVSRGSLDALLALTVNVGDLWLLGCLLLWSLYTVAVRGRPSQLHPMVLLFAIAIQAIVVLAPFAAFEYASGERLAPTPGNIAALLFIGLFTSFVAYVTYNRGIELGGARLAGLYTYLTPVYGVILAWAFLGERLAPFHLLGIALILAGILLASRLSQGAKEATTNAPNESPG